VSGARTLDGWLEYISNLHPVTIELTLERVAQVWRRLRPDAGPGSMGVPVIMVGGTNGKGSTCTMLEAILDRAGYRVGCYTSPHLLRYNERVRISRQDATDADLCRAFEAVEAARGDIGLTYFEFGTLAAFWLMIDARVDVAVLEVGLGGNVGGEREDRERRAGGDGEVDFAAFTGEVFAERFANGIGGLAVGPFEFRG
jgi:dihydrofolate synthase/folylpolyglutamate synthase